KAMNMEKKPIITLPCFLASLYGKWMKTKEKKKGFENGLDLNHIFNDIMCQCLYFDPSSTANELNYGRGGLEKSINKTVTASLKNLEE
ncbi:MAG: hypothetical protein R3232_12025, partial [Clostridia bacterium]|nr:hypothetical protein [Clostridia bacterium]